MKQNDFYEVDGCIDFIPVKLIKEHKSINFLEVEIAGSGLRTFEPMMYKFPKVHEQQKVVIPKFVADLIKELKKCGYTIGEINENIYDDEEQKWIDDNEELFYRAWLDGYEIEKEKLYTVEIPNPNLKVHTILQKVGKGLVLIIVTNARWRGWAESKLTEAEIKQDFDFLWQFAKVVE